MATAKERLKRRQSGDHNTVEIWLTLWDIAFQALLCIRKVLYTWARVHTHRVGIRFRMLFCKFSYTIYNTILELFSQA
jgi:hypothetical protein